MADENKNHEFYARNYSALLDTCLANRNIFIQDAERMVAGLAAHLASFTGSTNEEFLAWAADILKPAADRLSEFYKLRTPAHEQAVVNGIRAALKGTTDLGFIGWTARSATRELSNRVWTSVYLNLEEWTASGTARMTTRLQSKARAEARGWKTEQLRTRARYEDIDVFRIGEDAPDFRNPLDPPVLYLEPESDDDDSEYGTEIAAD